MALSALPLPSHLQHPSIAPRTFTMSESGAERLPDEILTIIFRCLLSGSTQEPLLARLRAHWLSLHKLKDISISARRKRRSFINVMTYKRHLIVSASRVCRRWNQVANEILYRDVFISDRKAKIRQTPFVSRLLVVTLTTSPPLGRIMRRLNIKGDNCSKEEAKNHIEILKMSAFLEDVTIIGYHGDFLDEYKKVISRLRELRTLHICKLDPPFLQPTTFLNARDLLAILPKLPKMEEIGMVDKGDDPNTRASLDKYCKKRNIEFYTVVN